MTPKYIFVAKSCICRIYTFHFYGGFLSIECKKYKNLETKCVTTSPGLPNTSDMFY